jgi:t-SNARE complex subunit (syntaxin)
MVSREEYIEMRGAKIAHVAQSIDTIHTLYESINEIVQQQGITLNRIEDNVVSGKEDVVKAKQEM